ncbi:hypothetical protein HKX48_002369 [Thoreauomyces humboldtii]|nr:hypothetical protein HKX48_002369 [Thoreauomyces humboldtii]
MTDYSIGTITATNACVGVSAWEDQFDEIDDAGIIGFAFGAFSQIGNVTNTGKGPIEDLNLQKFGLYLQSSRDGDDGEITLNRVNSARFTGSINYYPVTGPGFWSLQAANTTISLGNETVQMSSGNLITDSGTPSIGFGLEANALLGLMSFSANGTVECSYGQTGPDLTITLDDGKTYDVPASEYVIALETGDLCTIGITASSGTTGVLGSPFLRSYYTVHDVANQRQGFAKAVHPPNLM